MRALPTLVEDLFDVVGRPYDGVDHVVLDDVCETMLDPTKSDRRRHPWEGSPMFSMRRRDFVALLGGAAAWPIAARGQQAGKVYRIGFLANDPTIPTTAAGAAFRDGLSKGGFVEGDNILIDWRFAEGKEPIGMWS
jgi:hypothetical protein